MSSNGKTLFKEGDLFNLRDSGEWRPLLLTEATGSRITRQTNGSPVLESYSVSGDVNEVRINSGSAKLGGGTTTTANSAACFAFPLKKPDGSSYKLNEQFNVDIFMEWTDTPGATNNNTCFFAVCLTDGNVNFAVDGEQGLFGPVVIWNHATGPKVGTVSRGGSFNVSNPDASIVYLRGAMTTTDSGADYPVYRAWSDGYDSGGDIEQSKDVNGTAHWGGSMSSRPTVDAALSVGIGRHTTKASHSNFDIRIYYRVSPVATYLGDSTLRPGT
jgi:hypothetical protein|tara:strand:+ start:156 stop:971 length:816 start_codon:yes stop_codon:yes gene_type:complete